MHPARAEQKNNRKNNGKIETKTICPEETATTLFRLAVTNGPLFIVPPCTAVKLEFALHCTDPAVRHPLNCKSPAIRFLSTPTVLDHLSCCLANGHKLKLLHRMIDDWLGLLLRSWSISLWI